MKQPIANSACTDLLLAVLLGQQVSNDYDNLAYAHNRGYRSDHMQLYKANEQKRVLLEGGIFSVNQVFPVENSILQSSGLVAKSSVFKTRQL